MIIYCIVNTVTKKAYIGQTVQTLAGRLNLHRKAAKRGVKTAIGAAIRKYGWEAFSATVLETCSTREELDAAEIKCIADRKTLAPHGYNLRTGGGEGYKLTEAFRESLRVPRGPFHSEEFKRRQSGRFKGKARSPETVARITATNRAKSDMTMEKAEEIRQWRKQTGATYIETAQHFRLPQTQVNKILSYAAWK